MNSEPMKKPNPAEPAVSSEVKADAPASEPARDVALVHGVTEDGEGLRVLRQREGRLEAGAVRPLREGVPIAGEVIKLRPRPEFPLLCDVDVEVPAPVTTDVQKALPSAPRKGPAQVASDSYRQNWDVVFGAPRRKPELAN